MGSQCINTNRIAELPEQEIKQPKRKDKEEAKVHDNSKDSNEIKTSALQKIYSLPSDQKMSFQKVYVKDIFDKYDSYDKGFLDHDDFKKLLEQNGKQNFTQEQIKDLLTRIDSNKNKLVEQNELFNLYKELLIDKRKN